MIMFHANVIDKIALKFPMLVRRDANLVLVSFTRVSTDTSSRPTERLA